jgi:hypothetical protein
MEGFHSVKHCRPSLLAFRGRGPAEGNLSLAGPNGASEQGVLRPRPAQLLGWSAPHKPIAIRVFHGFLGDMRSARGGICVFFATLPVFLESVTVQDGFFDAMSRNDNSGGYKWSRSNQRD